MGCDFYTYYEVCIEYKKDDKTKVKTQILEDTRDRHYFWEIKERDEDFEELNDYYERCHLERKRQIDDELSRYEKKEIYKDGKWLCIESSREKYINMYKKMGILDENIISIWKQGGFNYR
jgi:hypothetical protein